MLFSGWASFWVCGEMKGVSSWPGGTAAAGLGLGLGPEETKTGCLCPPTSAPPPPTAAAGHLVTHNLDDRREVGSQEKERDPLQPTGV